MTARHPAPPAAGYPARLAVEVTQALVRLNRKPLHSRRLDARRRLARRWLGAGLATAAVIAVLVVAADLATIRMMPPRGTPALWPVRIFTDFAKSIYVLAALAFVLVILTAMTARLKGWSHAVLTAIGVRVQYVFFSVVLAAILGEIVKETVGRGRPFVGGADGHFTFSHFAHSEAFASFPSGHTVTVGALAFAVSAVWPRSAVPMWIFAGLICLSRLVLLAHHPSDVIAGLALGAASAMAVRYWFASRRLAFTIRADGTIVPLAGPSAEALKRVAAEALAP